MILRRTPDQMTTDLRQCLSDHEATFEKVHVLHLQPSYFTPAETAECEHEHQDAVLLADLRDRILSSAVGQPEDFFAGQETFIGLTFFGKPYTDSRVTADPLAPHSKLKNQIQHTVDVDHRCGCSLIEESTRQHPHAEP